MRFVIGALAAFLIGSLPWGLWIGKLTRGVDVRRFGSGNLGATNVYRVLGPAWGITVLLLDAAKGAAAVLVVRLLAAGGLEHGGAASLGLAWAGLIGLAASVLGHSFSPFAGFRGGKGVATAAGAWGVLAPVPLALALLVWIPLFAATRIVSAASIAATLALVPAVVLAPGIGLAPPREASVLRDPVFWFAVLTALLLVTRHAANLRRLRQGREKPLDLRRKSV